MSGLESRLEAIADLDGLYRFPDRCWVYALRDRDELDLVDVGRGDIFRLLDSDQVRQVVLTHHHRDQTGGLRRVSSNARILAPETEAHLIDSGVDEHLRNREVFTNYNTREDRFSTVDPVEQLKRLRDHDELSLGGSAFSVVPTPGHTTGSISFVGDVAGQRVAFIGDLMAATGRVHSLAATEWSYGGGEGLIATITSLRLLMRFRPDVLLPSHGDPIWKPVEAVERLIGKLEELIELRDDPPALWTQRPSVNNSLRFGRVHDLKWMRDGSPYSPSDRLREFIETPFEVISPHLLVNKTASGNTHVLLSETGEAMFFDYGYDMFVWPDPAGFDRAKVRTWNYTLESLKSQYGVTRVSAVAPTHYHDDHMAGMNALRLSEGTEVWAPELMVDVLERPERYDLPCLWFEPTPVDMVLPNRGKVSWNEYEIDVFPLPGHTVYAAAYGFEVDGRRVLNVGDQYRADSNGDLLTCAFIYKNGFRRGDFALTAVEIAAYEPDLLLSGHWAPFFPALEYFDELLRRGALVQSLHDELLPSRSTEAGAEAFPARIDPFVLEVAKGAASQIVVEITNPYPRRVFAEVELESPLGWWGEIAGQRVELAADEQTAVRFDLPPVRRGVGERCRLAADVLFDGIPVSNGVDCYVVVI